jgi:hypothetical protein
MDDTFMNARLHKLAERKAGLVNRVSTQRNELARALNDWHEPLALLDQGIGLLRYLRSRPMLVIGMTACVAILRPRRVFGWLRGGWLVWRMIHKNQ